MKEVVEALVRLQDFDSRLNHLKLQKGDLPVLIEDLDSNLQSKKSHTSDLKSQIDKLQNDRQMFQKEIGASKAQLKKFEEQLYKVQNNKEYDALSLEIDTKKMEVESLESKILQTMEEEEGLKQQIAELDSDVNSLGSQLDENRKELEEIDLLTREEESKLLKKREGIAKNIDDRFLRQYERIRTAKDGLAVAPVNRASCGGCFSAIPPQRIAEIREGNRLFNCEYCGRILVWAETEEV